MPSGEAPARWLIALAATTLDRHVPAVQLACRQRHQRHVALRGAMPDDAVARPRRRRRADASTSSCSCARRVRGGELERGSAGRRSTTAQSAGALVGEDARLGPRRRRAEIRVPVEVIGRQVEQRGDPRMERVGRSRAGSCWPRRRAACRASTRSTWALSGTPMLPPTSTRRPEASSIRPTSVVVVDLPLVPVMAMTRPLQPARRQLELADHRHAGGARRLQLGQFGRHAGAGHDRDRRRSNSARSWPPEVEGHADRRAADPSLGNVGPVGQRHRARRGDTSSSAAARPLRAAPTTSTRGPRR